MVIEDKPAAFAFGRSPNASERGYNVKETHCQVLMYTRELFDDLTGVSSRQAAVVVHHQDPIHFVKIISFTVTRIVETPDLCEGNSINKGSDRLLLGLDQLMRLSITDREFVALVSRRQ